ncbi:MAG: ATP-dependent Clp protease ATP-binding subunit [Ruminococcaceae bacterium]|nr:ATP-dependent Clp protease ATP-binding subunit [Oscillospiraceae bacterium]
MVMCSKCHKRVAVVFVAKVENGNKVTEGLCMKCAKELGIPVETMLGNVMDKMGIPAEMLQDMEGMEGDINEYLQENGLIPSQGDDDEEGGAPAIPMPKLFETPADGVVPSEPDPKGGSSAKKEKGKDNKPKFKYLDVYCRNLTRRAAEGKLDRIVGREREMERVIQILCRRQKNNPCLIGEPGVGKTAIAEALAQRIAEDRVPYKLRGKQIYLMDLTALVAGTQFRGQFESRILGLLNEVKAAGNIILVIDEVHNIVGTGDAEGGVNAANILKPALSRGEIRIIGATTLNEYRKYIEKDTALERRFQPVTVNEPSVEETVEMLGGIKHYYEDFHAIRIPDDVVRRTVVLSERYITDRYLPDKAIDLLDEAASHLSLSSSVLNEAQELREQLLTLKEKREEAEAQTPVNDNESQKLYEEITKIKADELRLSQRLREIEPSCENVVLSEEDIAEVIEVWTGIPASSISQNEFERIDTLKERLLGRIIGQDQAVEAVSKAIKRNRAGISYKRKPVSFIFAGPTGVGKTELVKTLAADLFNSPETLIRLDMSEFMEKHSVSRIIGAPPGYVGYDEAGQLTEKIRRRPYSVILFDEIEKAHPDVLNIMLQILDDGRITDARGKTVNFENTIIVMTTNAGSDNSAVTVGFAADSHSASENRTLKALSGFLRPEFLNRVDEIITFNSLTERDFSAIAKIMLDELKTALGEKNILFKYSDEAADKIAKESYSLKFGARNMRRYIRSHVEDQLAEKIISDYNGSIGIASLFVDDEGKLTVECV